MAAMNSRVADFHMISTGLYCIANNVIGTEREIVNRRQSADINCAFVNCDAGSEYQYLMTGSIAEGFYYSSADGDFMFVNKNAIVLGRKYCNSFSTKNFGSVLIMETTGVPPGYTLLRCLKTDTKDDEIFNSLEQIGNEVYVSSLVRERFLNNGITTVHGPSRRGEFECGMEYDFAYSLKCPFWPEQAEQFIHRSIHQGWPSIDVLTEMVKDGCALVPINSKQETCSDMTDLEWRISFSLAEKKLVYSMNHSQFLCYGLMKIFLKEILQKIPGFDDLLCSYFMKTAVFWEISENKCGWSPLNFIDKVWNVFCRIIKWISTGYCPNFFIPENNMFITKIYGDTQRSLMTRFRSLYEEGYQFFLRCESLTKDLSICIEYPYLFYHIAMDNAYRLYCRFEVQVVENICGTIASTTLRNDVEGILKTLYSTTILEHKSDVMSFSLGLRINFIIQETALAFYSTHYLPHEIIRANKMRYQYISAAKLLLKKVKTYHCMSELQLASCAYVNGQYNVTIQICHSIKRRLQRQPYMYIWNLNRKVIMECRQLGMSYDGIVRAFVLGYYRYIPEVSINELKFESYAMLQCIGDDIIPIPPIVFLNLLLILSHDRLNEFDCRNNTLRELQSLVWYDKGNHVDEMDKVKSWEILGICQQLCGDYQGAYQSYVKALNDQHNNFKAATLARLHSLYLY